MSVAPSELERLHAWLDGELSNPDEQALLGALERDPALRAEAHALREARDVLRRVVPAVAPEGFTERVLQAVAHEPVSLDRWRALRRPFGVPIEAVALAAAVLLVVVVGLRGRGEDATPTIEGFVEDTPAAPAAPAPAPASEAKEINAAEPVAKKSVTPAPTSVTPTAAPNTKLETVATTAPSETKGGTAYADLPRTAKTIGDGYAGQSYTITSNDPDVSSTIQSIAAKHGARAKRVTDETGQDTWFLDLDPKQLRSFVADLDKLGIVSSSAGPEMQLGQTMPVQVKVAPADAKTKPSTK